ncbi:RNA polymerase sigma factor [Phenylobacterium sp.]|uniref:RNA polymerase sigma factor n=1 Tax=Phenylobacterium sp. TaxID=1871053 RepID=UPI003568EB73
MGVGGRDQDEGYEQAAAAFGPALERLARAYEADPELRRDLLQDIHTALWRSFADFAQDCSVRTWVYRVAHNVGASHVLRRRRENSAALASLDELAAQADGDNPEQTAGERQVLARMLEMISRLKPPDAQVMLLYLEDLDAAEIGEVTGLSAGAVATRIYRIKAVLARRFRKGGRDDD